MNRYDLLQLTNSGHRLALPLASASMRMSSVQQKDLAVQLRRMNRQHVRRRRIAIGCFALSLIELERWRVEE